MERPRSTCLHPGQHEILCTDCAQEIQQQGGGGGVVSSSSEMMMMMPAGAVVVPELIARKVASSNGQIAVIRTCGVRGKFSLPVGTLVGLKGALLARCDAAACLCVCL